MVLDKGLTKGNLAILVAAFAVWLGGATQREKPVINETHAARLTALEARAAAAPDDAERVRALAQGYLDARAPGMALAAVERAPTSVRQEPRVEHLYARALLDQGRSADALAAERRVLARCADPSADAPVCSTWLIASATRRADILVELAKLGVEDANAHPEASLVAYHKATHQVRLSVR